MRGLQRRVAANILERVDEVSAGSVPQHVNVIAPAMKKQDIRT